MIRLPRALAFAAVASLTGTTAGAQSATQPANAAGSAKPAVSGPYGIEGYQAGHAYFYVVPIVGGVVLVDTGAEDSAETVLAAVAGRPVKAILLTHGHRDHFQGAYRLGDVPTYAHRRDILRVLGREKSRGPLPGLLDRIFWPLPPPQHMLPVRAGENLTIDGATFAAIHLPGHTAGGLAWLYRDVLFSGDALLGGEKIGLSPFFFSDDSDEALRSARKLLNVPFKVMLDGHTGRTDDADSKLRDFLK